MLRKWILTVVVSITTFIYSYSQPSPGDWDEEGPIGTPGAPIDNNIIILIVAAMLIGVYFIRKDKQFNSRKTF